MVGGGLQQFSVSPSPLGTNLVFKVWLGSVRFRCLGTKGVGPGLEE